MGKATGVFLVFAGLGTAALVLPSVDREAERQLSDIVRHAMSSPADTAPTAPASAPVQTPAPAVVDTKPAVRAAAITTGSIDSPVVVQNSERPTLLIAPTPATPPTTTAASGSGDLTRAIQKELRRVGCYSGEVTGDWNDQTRKSMRQFVERVNATLPVDQPDHILKMLVQGHPGNACGEACPQGQQLSEGGRCLPNAILAKKPTLVPKRSSVQTAETEMKPLAARMPVKAKNTGVENMAATAPGTATSSWSTTVAAASNIPSPVAAPLPGRMSIGAPRPAAAEARPQPGSSLSGDQHAAPKRMAAKPASDDADEVSAPAASVPAVRPPSEPKKVRAASSKVRAIARAPSRVASAPPVQRMPSYRYSSYSSSSYTASSTPRRFGPHIFSDTRWAR